MSVASPIDATPSSQDEAETLASQLAALRNEGAERFEPVRFHYLERLSQRLAAETGTLRRVLEGRLQAALAHFAERFEQAQQAAGDEVAKLSAERPDLARALRQRLKAGDYQGLHRLTAQAVRPTGCTPLVQLNQYIRNAAQSGNDSNARPEMKSVRRFRETWSRIAAVDQVDQALGRGPDNAGPLNSHMLVLRSLASMRELSPEYLRRFLSYVDTLLWLDQAGEPAARSKPKPAKRGRQKK